MDSPTSFVARGSSLPTIQIFSPGTQLEVSGTGSQAKSETVESAASLKTEPDRGTPSRSVRKRNLKREKPSPKSGGESSRHRQYSAKRVKQDDDDVFAHLHPLQDYLQYGLDVVFCGINPGRMSAETGHHFANPTNHFWRCLYRSGLTTTLVAPSEDFSLPERFNIGLTNLVDRPSTQACELSRVEMITSVPAFLDKLARYRPRVACFVGVIIWEIVRNSLVRSMQQSTPKRREKGNDKDKGRMGLQTYKLVYGNKKAGLPRETLLFVVPCTSGRVVKYQLSDKTALFTELHKLVKMPSSEIDSLGIQSISLKSGSPG